MPTYPRIESKPKDFPDIRTVLLPDRPLTAEKICQCRRKSDIDNGHCPHVRVVLVGEPQKPGFIEIFAGYSPSDRSQRISIEPIDGITCRTCPVPKQKS